MSESPDAFVHGLAALVDEEKERLKHSIASDGTSGPAQTPSNVEARLEELAFELRELRGCMESLQASVDGLIAKQGG